MYDMVKGNSPQTQGENDVSKPAPYMMGRDVTKLDGSCCKLSDAKLLATDSAWYTTSSHAKFRAVVEPTNDGGGVEKEEGRARDTEAGWCKKALAENGLDSRTDAVRILPTTVMRVPRRKDLVEVQGRLSALLLLLHGWDIVVFVMVLEDHRVWVQKRCLKYRKYSSMLSKQDEQRAYRWPACVSFEDNEGRVEEETADTHNNTANDMVAK